MVPESAGWVPTPDLPSDVVDFLLQQAEFLFEEGRTFLQEGRVEAARFRFRQALGILKSPTLEFSTNPRLEAVYFAYFAETRALELQSSLVLTDLPMPEAYPAPHDELADLNLYTIEVDPHLRDLVHEDLLETRFDIPVVLNDSVVRFLNYFSQNRGRRFMEQGLARSGRFETLFKEIFEREGVPLDLIYMAHIESNFNPHALSRARAKGLWQFMAGTGRLYGLEVNWWIDERSDIVRSTEAAARYLRDLYEKFGDWHLAMAAYNVGPGRIERIRNRHGEIDYWTMTERRLLPRETSNFVPSILASLIIFRSPQRYGFDVTPEADLEFESIEVDDSFDLQVLAELVDLPVGQLLERNPELTRGVTPPDFKSYRLKVPPGTGERLARKMSQLPPEKRLRVRHYRVRQGDTLSAIARRFSTSIQAVAQVNRIANIHRLRLGQELIIPLSPGQTLPGRAVTPSGGTPTFHTVRRGDSIARISHRYGLRVNDVLRWNNLSSRDVIYPGQKIRLRPVAETASATASAAGPGQE